jgi:hypothetical protein
MRAISALVLAALTALGPASSAQPAADWIASSCTAPGGLFRVHPNGRYVSGYFGNILALGLVQARQRLDIVRDWMAFYIEDAHDSGSGVDGVPDDVRIEPNGSLVSRGRPDSTDAYGATFLMLARAAYESRDESLRALISAHRSDILRIGDSAIATQQPNGLTWSRPQHHIAYAIDNEQVYRGLLDGAVLARDAFGDSATAQRWEAAADRVSRGMQRYMWDPGSASYRPYVGARFTGNEADLSRAYPDALAQAMAIVYNLPGVQGARAASLLSRTYVSLTSATTGNPQEYQLVYELALARSGSAAPVSPFVPSDVCVDAGWYLLLATNRLPH